MNQIKKIYLKLLNWTWKTICIGKSAAEKNRKALEWLAGKKKRESLGEMRNKLTYNPRHIIILIF